MAEKTVRVNLTLPKSTADKFLKLCREKNLRASDIVAAWVEEATTEKKDFLTDLYDKVMGHKF